jgi:hypothetical protein
LDFSFVVGLHDRSRCQTRLHAIKAGLSKARSGIAGILLREDPRAGARNQNSENPPLDGNAARARVGIG